MVLTGYACLLTGMVCLTIKGKIVLFHLKVLVRILRMSLAVTYKQKLNKMILKGNTFV